MAQRTPAAVPRRGAEGEPLAVAVAVFLSERDLAPATHRVYALALTRLTDQLGADTPVAGISPRMLADSWPPATPTCRPASWNRVVATLGSLFAGLDSQLTGGRPGTPPGPPTGTRTPATAPSRPPNCAPSCAPNTRFGTRPLWWLLYETAARAGAVLALDVDDLDLARRRAVVIGNGGRAELIGWETQTARLLPQYQRGRDHGPVFLADIAPAPARQPAVADPASGRARLSYRRAEDLFRDASGGWTLHSGVTAGSPTSPKPACNSRTS